MDLQHNEICLHQALSKLTRKSVEPMDAPEQMPLTKWQFFNLIPCPYVLHFSSMKFRINSVSSFVLWSEKHLSVKKNNKGQ